MQQLNDVVLYLSFNQSLLKNDLQRIQSFYKKKQWEQPEIVIINNKLTGEVIVRHSPHMWEISGDNSSWEFSALARSVDYSSRWIEHFEKRNVLWLNDGVGREKTWDKVEKEKWKNLSNRLQDSLVGHVDHFSDFVSLEGFLFNSWIRSNFFFSSGHFLQQIRQKILDYPLHLYIDNKAENLFKEPFKQEGYFKKISSWLTVTEGEKVEAKWHKSDTLREENHLFLKQKAKSIMREHLISCMATSLGYELQSEF